MRKCRNCGGEKELSEYESNPNRDDGLSLRCKECVKMVDKYIEYRKTNPTPHT